MIPRFVAFAARAFTLLGPSTPAEDSWTSHPIRLPPSPLDQGVGTDETAATDGCADLAVTLEAAFRSRPQNPFLIRLVLIAHRRLVTVLILLALMDGFAAAVGLLPQVHPRNHAGIPADTATLELPLGYGDVALGQDPVRLVEEVPQVIDGVLAKVFLLEIKKHLELCVPDDVGHDVHSPARRSLPSR
ncbi:hypothetical protein ACFWA6_14455 [Streptomyces sp. NPDC060020]|uniref:hypothetical protein n=1 Tax=Streptomyces sp. NPDC060020 TaxID=3347038 RepID=UPI0036A394CD